MTAWFIIYLLQNSFSALLEVLVRDQTPTRLKMVFDKIIFCVRRNIQHEYWNNVRKQNWILKSKQRTETMMKTNRKFKNLKKWNLTCITSHFYENQFLLNCKTQLARIIHELDVTPKMTLKVFIKIFFQSWPRLSLISSIAFMFWTNYIWVCPFKKVIVLPIDTYWKSGKKLNNGSHMIGGI